MSVRLSTVHTRYVDNGYHIIPCYLFFCTPACGRLYLDILHAVRTTVCLHPSQETHNEHAQSPSISPISTPSGRSSRDTVWPKFAYTTVMSSAGMREFAHTKKRRTPRGKEGLCSTTGTLNRKINRVVSSRTHDDDEFFWCGWGL